jgi:hypothetical protein
MILRAATSKLFFGKFKAGQFFAVGKYAAELERRRGARRQANAERDWLATEALQACFADPLFRGSATN